MSGHSLFASANAASAQRDETQSETRPGTCPAAQSMETVNQDAMTSAVGFGSTSTSWRAVPEGPWRDMLPVYLSVSLHALVVIGFVVLTTYGVMTYRRSRRDRRTGWPWLGPLLMSVAMLIYFGRRLYFGFFTVIPITAAPLSLALEMLFMSVGLVLIFREWKRGRRSSCRRQGS